MKIVIAPDSFKESLTAIQAAAAIENGLRRVLPTAQFVKIPMADGGEGTVRAAVAATGGKLIRRPVTGPLGGIVTAAFGLMPDGSAIMEMAAASGLPLIPVTRRNPERASSYGTGELIKHALSLKVRRIVIGIGGSATNDCGAGMAQALGVVFRNRRGRILTKHLGGGDLASIAEIDLVGVDARLHGTEFLVACDVVNPLVGPRGATAIFGPQKGATPVQLERLEKNLVYFGCLVEKKLGRRLINMRGAGAAGGLGLALMAFANGLLVPGAPLMLEIVRLRTAMKGADLVVTGEGFIDGQTGYGKAPAAVAALARTMGIPAVGIGGALAKDASKAFRHGFAAVESTVARPMTTAEALRDARVNLESAAERVGRWIVLSRCGKT